MLDFFAPTVPADALYSEKLRVHAVQGDYMSPRLRGGHDFVLIKPCDRLLVEGCYLYHDGFGPALANVQLMKDKVRLFGENDLYPSGHLVDRADFEESILGVVVADLAIKQSHLLQQMFAA